MYSGANPSQPYPGYSYSQPVPRFIVQPVLNVEEAKNASFDAMSIYLFPDFGNNRIYVKQINNEGIAMFHEFGLKIPEPPPPEPMDILNARIGRIEQLLGGIIGESNAADSNGAK